MADRSVGLGRKERRYKDVTAQDTSNVYGGKSTNKEPGKSAYDKALLGTKPEKRGRKKAGSAGKSKEDYKTSKQKVRARRAIKQTKAKKGGK